MAEEVTDPDELAAFEALTFRFRKTFLDRLTDGRTWILTRGLDYPQLWTFATLKVRLYQNGHSRGKVMYLWQLSEEQSQVRFEERSAADAAYPRSTLSPEDVDRALDEKFPNLLVDLLATGEFTEQEARDVIAGYRDMILDRGRTLYPEREEVGDERAEGDPDPDH